VSLLYYFTFEGGFDIKTKDDIVPTLFLDDNAKSAIFWFFNDLVKWVTAVGFVPIVYPADMSRWASGSNVIERVLKHFFEKISDNAEVSTDKNKKRRRTQTQDNEETQNKRRKSELRNDPSGKKQSIEERTRNIKFDRNALRIPGQMEIDQRNDDDEGYKTGDEEGDEEPQRKIEKKIRKSMNVWKTKRGFSSGMGSMQYLPMCIPDPFLGDFEMYMNTNTLQAELVYVPLSEYEQMFSDKRVVVYMSQEYRLDSACRLRTPAASLFARYKITQVILENNLRAESELSKPLIISQMQQEKRDMDSLTQNELLDEVEEGLKDKSGGKGRAGMKLTFDQWAHVANISGVFGNRSDRKKSDGSEGGVKYTDDTNVNMSVSGGSGRDAFEYLSEKKLTLNQIKNQMLKSIKTPESQKYSMMKDHIVLPGGFTVQNVTRPSSILDPQKYKEDYQNDVCTSLGVPYHLIATEKGKYKPTEGQDSLFRKSVSMIRNEIEVAFSTIYAEAFSPLDGKLTNDVVERLNELTNGILNDITYHQIDRAYNTGYNRLFPVDDSIDSATVLRDNVLRDATNFQIQKLEAELNANNFSRDGKSPPKKKISNVNVDEIVGNMIPEKEVQSNALDMRNTLSVELIKKKIYEPDEITIVLTKCRQNIIRMVHLIEKCANQQNQVRLQFKLPALVNLEMLEKYATFAANNPTMYAMVIDMGFNLFTSTK
jgi:hypothetical protein